MVMGFPLVDSNGCDLDVDPFEKVLLLFARLTDFESWSLTLQVIAEG
jgi:hypothetical protein